MVKQYNSPDIKIYEVYINILEGSKWNNVGSFGFGDKDDDDREGDDNWDEDWSWDD